MLMKLTPLIMLILDQPYWLIEALQTSRRTLADLNHLGWRAFLFLIALLVASSIAARTLQTGWNEPWKGLPVEWARSQKATTDRFCPHYERRAPLKPWVSSRVDHFSNFFVFPRFLWWFPCVLACWITWNNSFCRKTPIWPRPKIIFEIKCYRKSKKIEMFKSLQMETRKLRNDERIPNLVSKFKSKDI